MLILKQFQNIKNEKYGKEALEVDLVNGKYDEQIRKLNTLSKQKASKYVAENANNIKEDIEYVNDKSPQLPNITDDKQKIKFLEKYIDKYSHLSIVTNTKSTRGNVSVSYDLKSNGTREEVYNDLVGLFNDLDGGYSNDNDIANEIKEWISDTLNDYFDIDKIKQSKASIKKYAEAKIKSRSNMIVDKNTVLYYNLAILIMFLWRYIMDKKLIERLVMLNAFDYSDLDVKAAGYDDDSDAAENAPRCSVCVEPILDETALCDNDEWCCNNPDCKAEFLQSDGRDPDSVHIQANPYAKPKKSKDNKAKKKTDEEIRDLIAVKQLELVSGMYKMMRFMFVLSLIGISLWIILSVIGASSSPRY